MDIAVGWEVASKIEEFSMKLWEYNRNMRRKHISWKKILKFDANNLWYTEIRCK